MARCYNGGEKHKFEPRYTEKEKTTYFKLGYPHMFASDESLRRVNLYDEYVYDICIWCGKVVKEKIKE